MGYTRAQRHAGYAGGNKNKPLEEPDLAESQAVGIFYEKWSAAAGDEKHLRLKEEYKRNNR